MFILVFLRQSHEKDSFGTGVNGFTLGKRTAGMIGIPGSIREFRIWKKGRPAAQIFETMHQYFS